MKKKVKTGASFVTKIAPKLVTDLYGNHVPLHEIVVINPQDFKHLKRLPYNRNVLNAMVEKLGESVTAFGVLRVVVLIKYRFEYYIADGQHLIEYLDKAGLPVYAFIVPIEDNDDEKIMKLIVMMNNTARRWSLSQYAKNWLKFLEQHGDNARREAYQRLVEKKKTYGLSLSMLGELMFIGTQSEAKKAIRQGRFLERADPARIDKIISLMENFHNHTGVSINHTHTASGLARFIKDVGVEAYTKYEQKFIKAVKKYQANRPIPVFARHADSMEFWSYLYSTK